MKALLRKRSGYTLVEVIIVLAILGVLMGAMMLFFRPIITMLNTVSVDVRAESISSVCEDYLTRKLQYAKNLIIIQDVPYAKVNSDSAIQNELKTLGAIYNDNTSGYKIGCISLRKQQYRNETGRYWNVFCEETFTVNPTDGDIKLTSGETVTNSIKVFNDAFYCDVCIDCNFADGAGNTGDSKFTVLRQNFFCFNDPDDSIATYASETAETDASIYNTTGYITLLNLRLNKDLTGYNSQFIPYDNTADDIEDCGTYIFYIERKLKTA